MKQQILDQLISKVRTELASIIEASNSAKNYVRDGDIKSDGKYDTRSIEAGYLAGAQERRVEELKLELQMIEEIPVREFTKDEEVAIGCLVDIQFNNQVRKYFVAPTAGGTMLKVGDETILVISTFSPIGDAVLGNKVGDEFELETPNETRQYKVQSLC
tara:strand:+ start:1980 stop:2456 length:477 start_codon:yes stop_codon:yes gene_type:complete